ncbi:uncharacterized protein E6C27_scaffold98G001710 [Cucumis melo var. makuwa]|uniref:Reverse transcriptase domain-containing protein n=1 Tax=Cucumis melo var. makuwa TaxID=1194695 RepID=A0A5A7UV84_CUCMM|nr:uncharacterized protein E6C27_scaffold98G001710 [Cucumis melo var. makuwa]
MITPKVEVKEKTRPTFLPRSSPEYRLSPPIDYHKRSYAKVVTEGRPFTTSDSSDSYVSSDSSHSSGNSFCDSPSPDLLENTVVLVRRFFHDDWQKILQNLRKQTEESFTYNAFHAEKALVHFNSNIPENLLCQNKGWTTVGKYSVRFEKWSPAYHATPKLIPSYGGWTTFQRNSATLVEYDDFSTNCESLRRIILFDGSEAISPDFLSTSSRSRKSSTPDQPSALKSVIIKPDKAATSPTYLNEEVVNDSNLHATANKSRLEILSGIPNDGVLDKGKQKVDIQLHPNSALNLNKPKRKVSFNSPSNKTNIFNPDSAPANHSLSLSSPEKKQKVSRERSIKKKSSSIQPIQNKGVLITQPIQVVAHDLEASKKGLSLIVNLGDLPVLDPSKSFEDHHSSHNAEVIDITNTEVVPETPEMKMPVNENSNSSSEANYRKPKHVHRRRYYYRKKRSKGEGSGLRGEWGSGDIYCKMKLLTWNARGLGSPSKRALIKNAIISYSPDFVILTETMLKITNKRIIKSFWPSNSINWIVKNASGSSGGILILWDAQSHSLLSQEEAIFSLSANFFLNNNSSWWLTGLYGPDKRRKRIHFWADLHNLQHLNSFPWSLERDLNVIRMREETTSILSSSHSSRMLNNFISNNLLIDPPLTNNRFTWSNLRNPSTFSRIDRFLYNSSWENLFSPHTTRTLPRPTSDHFPLVCEDSNPKLRWGPAPFRLNSIALNDPEFKRNMERWWENSVQNGHPGFSFIQRLKSLANHIKPWQKEKLHSLNYAKETIIREVDSIDKKELDTPLSQKESNRRLALKAELSDLSLKESQFCIYKSSTKSDPLFIENLDWNPIEFSEWPHLCAPFLEEEIKGVINSFDGKKAPSPDGFPISFFKSYWHLLKEDIMDIFKDFFEKGVINKNMNNTYIALIGKKKDYSHPKDFRPISLTTSIYKIIAKTLSNRLKTTLPGTISGNQLAFIKNRQITDAILMANEAVDYWKVKKIKGFILKLDIEKVFYNLNWDFIDYVLGKKNFPNSWRKWIRGCISNVTYSVIINGRPQGRIKANRGLRQGDPLSPFLFVIAMDYFSRLLSHLEASGAIKGVSLNNNCNISHILFADDILLFVEDNDCFLNNLIMALSLFEKASGLKINLLKSALVPVNVSLNRAKECASFWGISCHSLLLSYLGVPLGGSNGSKGSHLINWTKVFKSKEEGGLGISRLQVTNKALLSKWLWRYFSEPNALWRRLIQCKYKGKHPGDIPSNNSSSSSKAPWRSIIDNIDWFKSNQSWDLNNGDQISFWYSNWSQEGCLSTAYPRLFALTLDKEISVKDAWNTIDNQWAINFRRELNDRERCNWEKILEILPTPRPNRGSSKPTWIPDCNKSFSIASAKILISCQLDQTSGDSRVKLLEIIWKSNIPMKIKFFMWCLIQRRISTMEVIQQRMSNTLLQPNWCVLCNKDNESGNHLFLRCDAVKPLWSLLLRSLNFALITDDFEALFSFFLSLKCSLPKHKRQHSRLCLCRRPPRNADVHSCVPILRLRTASHRWVLQIGRPTVCKPPPPTLSLFISCIRASRRLLRPRPSCGRVRPVVIVANSSSSTFKPPSLSIRPANRAASRAASQGLSLATSRGLSRAASRGSSRATSQVVNQAKPQADPSRAEPRTVQAKPKPEPPLS